MPCSLLTTIYKSSKLVGELDFIAVSIFLYIDSLWGSDLGFAQASLIQYYNNTNATPVEETLQIIKQQLIPKGLQPDLTNLARLCLTSTYFLWNRKFYEQASGAAVGSALSPVIVNIFMEVFEHEAIESSRMNLNAGIDM
ncbi:hypothetical protein Trydic_g13608 [Trypoxylus dichotomus]